MTRIRCLSVAAVPWLLCAAAFAQAPALRVGLVLPLSGESSDFGRSARLGAELAVKEINESGGYLGRTLQLVTRDDRSDPTEGRRAAEDLVRHEKVSFTVGYCNSGVALNSIDVFQNAQHILMVPCATGTEITRRYAPQQSFIFRIAPPDAIMVRFLASEIVERRELRKVAVFADTTGYGEGGLKDLRAELSRHGLAPVYVARFPLGVSSLTDAMREARAAGTQAVVAFTVGPEHAVAVRSRAEIGWSVPYFAPWPLSFRSVLEHAGPAALEGTMMVQSIVHDTANERRSSFLARYYAESKDRPIGSLMAAAQTYDAVQLMLRALFASHGDDSGPALKKALENPERSYAGVVTSYEQPFSSDDHDAFSINMVWLGVWHHGEIRYFDDQDARRSAMVRRKQSER